MTRFICVVHVHFLYLQYTCTLKCVTIVFQSTSADISPCVTPSTTPLSGNHAPKYGTVIPNRIFVGGIAANVSIENVHHYVKFALSVIQAQYNKPVGKGEMNYKCTS